MNRLRSLLVRLRDDRSGSTIIEFALLGPTMFAVLFGLFQMAISIQNFNALRSAGDDLSRYVVVQYQKGAKLTQDQIQTAAIGIAATKPYFLDTPNLDVSSSETASDMTGADKVTINMTYHSADILKFFGINGITLHYHKDLYVPTPVATP